MKLTYQQKLDALSYRFYQGASWIPRAGDFYTTSRADLELYQVVSVEDGIVRTRFTEGSEAIAEWPEAEFLTGGFGPKRVFVPEWIYPTPAPRARGPQDETLDWQDTPIELFEEPTPRGGVIRIEKWPEGYVLWYHGAIVWRSWETLTR